MTKSFGINLMCILRKSILGFSACIQIVSEISYQICYTDLGLWEWAGIWTVRYTLGRKKRAGTDGEER